MNANRKPNEEVKMRVPMLRPGAGARGLGVLTAILSLNLAAGQGAVKVYECRQDGQVTFSDQPCAGHEQRLEVDYSRPGAAQAQAAAQSAAVLENRAGTVAQVYVLDQEILSLEQQIANQETERDQAVADLRNRLAQGTEATDTAAWQAQLNQQITATYEGYNDRILAERARLADLKSQRAFLGAPQGSPVPAP